MTIIMPFQSGGDLVFCLVRDGEEVRYPDEPRVYPGIGTLMIAQPRVTFPSIEAARIFRHGLRDAPECIRNSVQ